MILINNYLHRDVLSDLIQRWMYHNVRPADAELVARLVNFNHTYVSRYLRRFWESVFGRLYSEGHIGRRVSVKRDLKEALVANPPFRNARIDELISNYRKHPEHYYSDTPFQGMLFFRGKRAGVLIGSCRIKRVRRLAEKAAHRIVDRIFESIKARAEALADDRARRLGIPRELLVTPPEEMQAEFVNAEARLVEDLRLGRPVEAAGEITINDVAGIKVILENDRQESLLRVLDRLPGCRITEKEFHAGLYNATNLVVSYRPDREGILSEPVGRGIVSLMEKRGMPAERTQQAFAEFVRTGEDTVSVEIIVSNYQETLESEIGRCMHEERIVRQRATKEYRGHLARNIEYLMEYLFAFSQSAERELPELPIKLWNRYLPDYFDDVLKRLYHIPSDTLPDEP